MLRESNIYEREPENRPLDILRLGDRLTVIEAATAAGVHPATVKRWLTQGVNGVKLRGFRLGSHWVTFHHSLDDFIRDCTASGPDRR